MTDHPKKARIVQNESSQTPDSKRLKDAVKQFVGQADRTNNMFADTLLDLVKRVEKLEKDAQRVAGDSVMV